MSDNSQADQSQVASHTTEKTVEQATLDNNGVSLEESLPGSRKGALGRGLDKLIIKLNTESPDTVEARLSRIEDKINLLHQLLIETNRMINK